MKAPFLHLNENYCSYLNEEITETGNAQTSCQNQEDNLFSTISTSNHQSNDISYVSPSEFLPLPRATPGKLIVSGQKREKNDNFD